MGFKTPNIDRIAKEGMTFTDYYAENSCTAGRATVVIPLPVERFHSFQVSYPFPQPVEMCRNSQKCSFTCITIGHAICSGSPLRRLDLESCFRERMGDRQQGAHAIQEPGDHTVGDS
jgi:hypothetical protein